ncbi:MAG: hypothetical protein CSA97_04410 [Bacteroidetes bacterium]|nr:MAG: hypothetical protein CSA97_04410 [Bacteroidota bacterium]
MGYRRRSRQHRTRSRINILIRLALLWLLLQEAGRLSFLLYQQFSGQSLPFDKVLGALLHGLRMDASVAGYVLVLLTLLLLAVSFLRPQAQRRVFLPVHTLLLVVYVGITVVDWELFRNWQSRIDITPFIYLVSPSEALASTPVWVVASLVGVMALLSYLLVQVARYFVWPRDTQLPRLRLREGLLLLLLAAFMILPIRGSLSVAPMNVATVAFSDNLYANQAAVNPAWNLLHDLLASEEQYLRYHEFLPQEESRRRFDRMMAEKPLTRPLEDSLEVQGDSLAHDSVWTNKPTAKLQLLRIARPNIVLVLMESQSAKFSSVLGSGRSMPRFDSLYGREGVAFSRMYSASTRSDKGIVSVLAGYPAQTKKSIIKYTRKLQQLAFFPRRLDSMGYQSSFYYGGDADFANIKTCAYIAGFQRVVEGDEFPSELGNSKWGVHDEYLYRRLLTDIDTARRPFFKMLFTLTNHEPFELPGRANGGSEEDKMVATARYADSCFGDFLDTLRRSPAWDSTLVIMLADHGHRLPGNTSNGESERYHIPMIWLGGALRDSIPHEVHRVSAQMDLAATLLGQLGQSHGEFPFSRDILRAKHGGAMVIYNNGYGWVKDSSAYFYDHDQEREVSTEGEVSDSMRRDGQAFFMESIRHYNGL